MDINKIKKLFVHRDDVYSIQLASGAYKTINSPVTDVVLESHINGKQTIGLYHLDKNDTVKHCCIDIDVNKPEHSKTDFDYEQDWATKVDLQVREVKRRLSQYGIVGYEEHSGFKGSHIWFFFENPIPASTARDINDVIFKDMKPVDSGLHFELFPKQTTIGSKGLGNLIKLPMGLHKKTGKFSFFKDPILLDIHYVNQDTIEKVIKPIDSIFINCHVMADQRSQALNGYLSHSGRLALAYILLNLGKEGEDSLREILKHTADYNEGKTNYYITQAKDKGYKPITCAKLQSTDGGNLCPGTCPNIRSGKSPIAFYYRHTGKLSPIHSGQTSEEIDVASRMDMFKREGSQYLYKAKNNDGWQLLSNFVVNINSQITRDDGNNVVTQLKGNVVHGEESIPIEIDARHMASPDKLRETLYNVMGNQGLFCDNYTNLQHAINKYTSSEKTLVREIFGYDEKLKRYMTPSTIIDSDEIRKNDEVYIDLSSKEIAHALDIVQINDTEYKELKTHIEEDLLTLTDENLTNSLLAHTMMPVIEPWLYDEDLTRYILFIKGASGEGKSFLGKVMSHFYSPNMITFQNWQSTNNNIGRVGYDFKDSLYLVDDWKKANIKEMGGALGILQSYADRSARGRLNKDASIQKTTPIRGVLLITGEDIAEGQSSVLARTITLNYEQPRKDLKKGSRVLKNKKNYSAITGRYIQHILGMEDKERSFQDYRLDIHEEFYNKIAGEHNDVRIARNYSLLLTSFHFFAEWFWGKTKATKKEKELKTYFLENMYYVLRVSAEQRPAEIFWGALKELLAVGKLRLQINNRVDDSTTNKFIPIIGFYGTNEVHLLLKTAINEIEKYLKVSGQSLLFSKTTITEDLWKAGLIKSPKPTRKKLNGQWVQTHLVDPQILTN